MPVETQSERRSAESRAAASPPPSPGSYQEEGADTATAAFHVVAARLAELKAYAAYYLTARLDGLKLTVRNLLLMAALGVVGLLAAGAMVITAVVLLLQGIAGALAVLCGHTPWLGDALCGVLVLVLIGAGLYFGLTSFTKTSRKQTVEKYASRQRQQRVELGHNVNERAGVAPDFGA